MYFVHSALSPFSFALFVRFALLALRCYVCFMLLLLCLKLLFPFFVFALSCLLLSWFHDQFPRCVNGTVLVVFHCLLCCLFVGLLLYAFACLFV